MADSPPPPATPAPTNTPAPTQTPVSTAIPLIFPDYLPTMNTSANYHLIKSIVRAKTGCADASCVSHAQITRWSFFPRGFLSTATLQI